MPKSKKVTFSNPSEKIGSTVRFTGVNARVFSNAASDDSPFAGQNFEPDEWKAFIEIEICHSLPNIIGPVQEGNYIGYTPETLAMSHGRLQFQQTNLRHLLKAYDPQNISRDRIIGCVVATYFPKPPVGGWKPFESAENTPAIRALIVLFKLAEGVNGLLGQHLASREKQSVSIESITGLDNIGLWRPSQPDLVVPLLEPGELIDCISRSESGNLVVGKFKGEQVVMVYGTGAPVDFRGVGVTPRPAEGMAKIVSVNAEEGEMHAIAAERIDELIIGQEINFAAKTKGIVREIVVNGKAWNGFGLGLPASAERPVLKIELISGPSKGRTVLRPMGGKK